MKYNTELIKKYRLIKGLSRVALADLVGVHYLTISRIEKGMSQNPATIKKIADILDLPMEDLVES